jgi:hypothetical protein
MIEPTTIFQRTQVGRDEIYKKSRGLTQSERLVLIVIDGTTSFDGIRKKLPVLTDERFNRALSSLQKKDLVLEVFLPMGEMESDEVESAVIDRFLQQDPLDPVTIIVMDPEEEFEALAEVPRCSIEREVLAPQEVPSANAESLAIPTAPATYWAPKLEQNTFGDIDGFVIQQQEIGVPAWSPPEIPMPYAGPNRREGTDRRKLLAADGLDWLRMHWGFILVGIGFAFILVFMLGRITG